MGWQVVELRDVISHRKEFIEIAPSEVYSRCRVQTSARGIVLRDRVAGSEIKTSQQQVCRTGEFLVAEIDAKLGGYGIVPEELNDAIVSSHYFLFEIDEDRLLRGFLDWYSRTPAFLDQVKARGSTNYAAIRPSNVLAYEIPLPSLDEQQRIVQRLDTVAALVAERRRAIEAAERETQALLLKAFQRAIDGAPLRPMSEIAPLVRRQIEIEANLEYTEIGVRSFYNGIFHRRTMTGSEFSWQDLFKIREGDLVFSNLMAWEKAIAVAAAHDEGTVGNHRMLTCEVNPNLATPSFLMAYFRTFEGFSRVVGHSPGTIARNKTLSSKKLPTIEVPVPTLATQHWFDHLEAKAREARAIRTSTAKDVEVLIPAMLHEIFNGQAKAA